MGWKEKKVYSYNLVEGEGPGNTHCQGSGHNEKHFQRLPRKMVRQKWLLGDPVKGSIRIRKNRL